MRDKQRRQLPHGVVQLVGLEEEELPVERHVEEVGHEGDLGDRQAESPREEGVDNASVAPAAGEGDPHQTEAPGSPAVCVEEFYLNVTIPVEVWPVDQDQSQCSDGQPEDDVDQAVDVKPLVLGLVQEVSCLRLNHFLGYDQILACLS